MLFLTLKVLLFRGRSYEKIFGWVVARVHTIDLIGREASLTKSSRINKYNWNPYTT